MKGGLRVSGILKYFEQGDAMEKNKEAVVTLKKDKASENIVIAGFFFVISVLATIYGIADVFTDARLPMGILFLIAGPIGVSFLSVVVAKGICRAAAAAEYSYAGSLEELCKQYYHAAFCKADTDTETKEDCFADMAHLISAPVPVDS